jgi:hypothetical protein
MPVQLRVPPTSSCLSYRLVDDELAPLAHPDPSHTAYGLPVDEVGWRPRCPLATHTRVCGEPLGPLPLLAIAHGVVVERGLLREGNAGCGRGSSGYGGWRGRWVSYSGYQQVVRQAAFS